MITTNFGGLEQRIEARRLQAEMLSPLVANDETLSEQVRLGLRDLDEALEWLHREASIGPADLLLGLTAWRLRRVMQMLRTEHGQEEVA
jgi:hypothetical protein